MATNASFTLAKTLPKLLMIVANFVMSNELISAVLAVNDGKCVDDNQNKGCFQYVVPLLD